MSTRANSSGGRKARGREVSPAALAEVREVLGSASRDRDLLIEHLHLIQDRFGCLRKEHLVALAEEMKLAMTEVYEVATFYHHFIVVETGADAVPAVTVRVCQSLTCSLFGSAQLLSELSARLSPKVRVIPAPCVGRCASAPVAVVNHNAIGNANAEIVKRAVMAGDTTATEIGAEGFSAYCHGGGYELLRRCHGGELAREAIIEALKNSGLRGLGGAGFPAGKKWEILRQQPKPRLLAVNIDEGEPGTFKDRHYLEGNPHRFLEGAMIAAWAIEAKAVYIYLRDEYAACRATLIREIALLQGTPPGPLPDIHLRRGAGAYICGEESAMIESIEGKRGMPRLRPPFVAEVGLFGRPTLEHNMETLYWVRDIVEKGPAWLASAGRRGRTGLRSFSVSGRVKKPGVHLAPAGISVRELIDEYCGGMLPGHEFYGYFPGGASGGMLPAGMGDLPLDFDTLNAHGCFIGSAAVIVFSHQDRARDLALNAMEFFRDESCGQCTPCRVGTAKAVALMQAKQWDAKLLKELAQTMADASICGLGQAAPNPLLCAMKYFPQEFSGTPLK